MEQSHDELSKITGIRFTNVATRAIVFNGINVEYAGSDPYRFAWKGLRIDSSSVIAPYNHFGVDISKDLTKFTYVFGLEASLDESRIFEDDFNIESMSTVKGLRMINQGLIPGVSMVKITSANVSIIDTLNVSNETKARYYTAIANGNTVYTPTKPFTYKTWTGLMSVTIDKEGFGSYLIGEGLNGGYTVEEFLAAVQSWFKSGLIAKADAAFIISPNPTYTLKDNIVYSIVYKLFKNITDTNPFYQWIESVTQYAKDLGVGKKTISSNPNIAPAKTAETEIKSLCLFGKMKGQEDKKTCGFDEIIADKALTYRLKYGTTEYDLPGGLLKAIIHHETASNSFDPHQYRYEPLRDYTNFSGPDGYTNITSHSFPFYNFALPGHNTVPQTITQGDKVAGLNPASTTLIKSFAATTGEKGWGLRTILTSDWNKDKDVTFDDLYHNDLEDTAHQGWGSIIPLIPSRNFTPQLLLSASYGLGQVMYWEATNATYPDGKTLIMKDSNTPYDIVDHPWLGIELAASIFKQKFSSIGPSPLTDDCDGWSAALERYNGNGSSAIDYRKDVCSKYINLYHN